MYLIHVCAEIIWGIVIMNLGYLIIKYGYNMYILLYVMFNYNKWLT